MGVLAGTAGQVAPDRGDIRGGAAGRVEIDLRAGQPMLAVIGRAFQFHLSSEQPFLNALFVASP